MIFIFWFFTPATFETQIYLPAEDRPRWIYLELEKAQGQCPVCSKVVSFVNNDVVLEFVQPIDAGSRVYLYVPVPFTHEWSGTFRIQDLCVPVPSNVRVTYVGPSGVDTEQHLLNNLRQ